MAFAWLIGTPLIFLLGSVIGLMNHGENLIFVLSSFSGTFWYVILLFVVVFSTWTTNDKNLYVASHSQKSMALFGKNIPRALYALICGIIGSLIAAINLLEYVDVFCKILAAIIPPFGAIIAADFYCFNASKYTSNQLTKISQINIIPTISLLISMVVSFLSYSNYIHLTNIAAFDGWLTGFVSHVLLMRTHYKFKPYILQTNRISTAIRSV